MLVPGAVLSQTRLRGRAARVGVCLPLTTLNLMILGPLQAFQVLGCGVCVDRIDPVGLAAWIRDERIEHMSTSPTIVHDLVHHPEVSRDHLRSLEILGVGGASCPEPLRAEYEQRFGRLFMTGYGLSEAPTAVVQETEDSPHVPGASGRAMPHVRVVITGDAGRPVSPDEIGEICIAPANDGVWADVWSPMLGYWNREEATAAALRDGMLHTGDLGRLDGDGYLYVEDRRSDVIIRGGSNVYPAEVERVLLEHPGVADCAVLGRPNERVGQEVVAAVVARTGSDLHVDDVLAHCSSRLARFKVPTTVTVVDALPRNANGKVLRAEVADVLGRS